LPSTRGAFEVAFSAPPAYVPRSHSRQDPARIGE
jgi:hypothetical protein